MTELELVRTGLDFPLEGFLLSREAMRCTPKTLEHYRYTLGSFTDYLAQQGIHDVGDITPMTSAPTWWVCSTAASRTPPSISTPAVSAPGSTSWSMRAS